MTYGAESFGPGQTIKRCLLLVTTSKFACEKKILKLFKKTLPSNSACRAILFDVANWLNILSKEKQTSNV